MHDESAEASSRIAISTRIRAIVAATPLPVLAANSLARCLRETAMFRARQYALKWQSEYEDRICSRA